MSVELMMKNIPSAIFTSIWIKIINQRIKLDMSLFFDLRKKTSFLIPLFPPFSIKVQCVYMKLKCTMKAPQNQIIHKITVLWPG